MKLLALAIAAALLSGCTERFVADHACELSSLELGPGPCIDKPPTYVQPTPNKQEKKP